MVCLNVRCNRWLKDLGVRLSLPLQAANDPDEILLGVLDVGDRLGAGFERLEHGATLGDRVQMRAAPHAPPGSIVRNAT